MTEYKKTTRLPPAPRSRGGRVSRYYDGPVPTTRHIGQVLPLLLHTIGKQYQDRPDLIMAAWPNVIGTKLAPMTQAISFNEGFLVVKVNNSTLYSLLNQSDKPRLIKNLRDKFPQTMIKSIVFQLG
ncbi:MAG: hypothetical protein S4CHLAM2_01150 [Chlamydiales bacterium]|nr:hypothetical protein [Chlamydiales bacterium]